VDALSTLRNFGVHLILSHQGLYQMEEDVSGVAGLKQAVNTNCENKVVFSISREDAEPIGKEYFSGELDTHKVKDVVIQTKFRPVESTRTIHMESSSSGSTEIDSYGSTFTSGQTIAIDHSGLILDVQLPVETESLIKSESEMHGTAYTDMSTSGTAAVPFIEHHEFKEVTGRTFYTVEEWWELFIGGLVKQDQRRATVKIGQATPIPLYTIDVATVDKNERLLASFKTLIYEKYPKAVEVDALIESRVARFIEAHSRKAHATIAHTDHRPITRMVHSRRIRKPRDGTS